MKLYQSVVLISIWIFVSCSSEPTKTKIIQGNGKVVTDLTPLEDFTRLSISGRFEIRVIYSDTNTISIESDENLQEYYSKSVTDGHFELKQSEQLLPSAYTKIVVNSSNQLKEIYINGSSTFAIDDQKTDSLKFTFEGSGTGSFAGEVDYLDIELKTDGSGFNVDTKILKAKKAKVYMNSGATIQVNVSDTLSYDLSNGATLMYFDIPELVEIAMDTSSNLLPQGILAGH